MPRKDINAPAKCPYCTLKMFCQQHKGQPYHGITAGRGRPTNPKATLEKLYDSFYGKKLGKMQQKEEESAKEMKKKAYWQMEWEKKQQTVGEGNDGSSHKKKKKDSKKRRSRKSKHSKKKQTRPKKHRKSRDRYSDSSDSSSASSAPRSHSSRNSSPAASSSNSSPIAEMCGTHSRHSSKRRRALNEDHSQSSNSRSESETMRTKRKRGRSLSPCEDTGTALKRRMASNDRPCSSGLNPWTDIRRASGSPQRGEGEPAEQTYRSSSGERHSSRNGRAKSRVHQSVSPGPE